MDGVECFPDLLGICVQIAERQNSNTISFFSHSHSQRQKYGLLFRHTISKFMTFLNLHKEYEDVAVFKGFVTSYVVWFFSTMCFQVSPQTVCTRRCIVTLVAFVWFFSTACFQRSLQNYCPRGRNLTLVAFVWLFSTVHWCIVTLVTFVWFNDIASCLHPSNQSHNFQDFAPLPMCAVFWPNGCFKLSQIYHWLLVSNNYNV